MKDRRGFEYEALLQIQASDLAVWQPKVYSDIFSEITGYVFTQNWQATTEQDTHRVYRGQDIVEIIRQWPNLQPPYPPVRQESEDVI